MNEYLIEYYNIPPNEYLEAVHLSDKSNCNGYKLEELNGYFATRKVCLADIEDTIIPYNNAWWLYTKADSVKEAINKFYDIFERSTRETIEKMVDERKIHQIKSEVECET